MARELIKEEGLLCGGSSGSAMLTAMRAAKDLEEHQKCVVILPDGVTNYLSKFLSDSWMIQRNFKEHIEDQSVKNQWLVLILTNTYFISSAMGTYWWNILPTIVL